MMLLKKTLTLNAVTYCTVIQHPNDQNRGTVKTGRPEIRLNVLRLENIMFKVLSSEINVVCEQESKRKEGEEERGPLMGFSDD